MKKARRLTGFFLPDCLEIEGVLQPASLFIFASEPKQSIAWLQPV